VGPAALAVGWRAPRGALPLGVIFAAIAILACAATGLLGLDRLPFTLCAFKAATGLPCPTCGLTRALGRLFARDVQGALAMNPLAVLATLGLVVWGLADLALLSSGRSLRLEVGPGLARLLRWTAVVALLVNWAYLVAVGR
jgi:Protein of unknown function (DUF2752)